MTEQIDWPALVSQWLNDISTHGHCDPVLQRIEVEMAEMLYVHEEESEDYTSPCSSKGLIDLIERHGLKATGDRERDLIIAAEILPKRRML